MCRTCGRLYVKSLDAVALERMGKSVLVEFACAKKMDFTQWPPDIELMDRAERERYNDQWAKWANVNMDDTSDEVY